MKGEAANQTGKRKVREDTTGEAKKETGDRNLTHDGMPDDVLIEKDFDAVSRDHLYRILVENMSEGALVINNQKIIVYSNRYFADLTGYHLEKVIGADFTKFLHDGHTGSFSKCMDEAPARRSFCELTLQTKRKGKVDILASINAFSMDGQVYYSILAIDISFQKKILTVLEYEVEERAQELAETNKRLRRINRELSDVNKYLDNFVHAIAHDLRAPVANLKLVEEMLKVAPESQKPQLLCSVFDNIERLDSTLKGLVEIIRNQSVKEMGKSGLDVTAIIEEVIREQQERIKSKNATIRVEKRTVDTITYVEGYIRSIARNMISNALKYSMSGRELRLDIVFDKTEDGYLLSFKDNGTGIDLEKHGKNLFKPFQRFTAEGKGMGIGLHIVNNMVQKNGGRIDVESSPGKGTAFKIYLKEYQE